MDVVKVANAKMARELRRVTVERGRDPGEFALVAFGGAGPLQAAEIARDMDMDTLVVPRSPGVFSARGLLLADIRMDESRAYTGETLDATQVEREFTTLVARLTDRFEDQGFDADEVSVARQLDLRYEGQAYELTVTMPDGEFSIDRFEEALARFHEQHEQLYGYDMPDEPLELVTLRVAGTVETPPIADDPSAPGEPAAARERDVYFDETGFVATPILDREAIAVGDEIEGPAIIEESGCTTLLPPNTTAETTSEGNLRIDL
jgi:N-methylhydantoinase A/acetone carboxylase, beta subunit